MPSVESRERIREPLWSVASIPWWAASTAWPLLAGLPAQAQRAKVLPAHKHRHTRSQSRVARPQVEIQDSTVRAIRNGADLLIVETKSKVVILTPGRGFSRVFR